ncbi:hypothetical protein HOLleu_37434 [Holothuria leucospilota]|uniref:Uncharacterized protein n=1 Tax=Holothuria leucospilota TaxID=206669 RepID=A0A9Q1BDB9_HOLLE|nr:hypothetical protein HOLleu_37434 [Holothuria leucospilota]
MSVHTNYLLCVTEKENVSYVTTPWLAEKAAEFKFVIKCDPGVRNMTGTGKGDLVATKARLERKACRSGTHPLVS